MAYFQVIKLAEQAREGVTVTVTQDLGAVLSGRTMGPRPTWVVSAFADMYPDSIHTSAAAATVLATEEDWDAVAGWEKAVGAAIDQTITGQRFGVEAWLVCEYLIDGDSFSVATTIAVDDQRSVGVVVLVATAATIEGHTATKARR